MVVTRTGQWKDVVNLLAAATGILFFSLLLGMGGARGVELQSGVSVRGTTIGGGQQYTIEVPPDALLFTVSVTSQKSGNHLDLFLNAPGVAAFPMRGNAAYSSENGFGEGSNEGIRLFSPEGLRAGTYHLLVEKVGKEGCDYDIVARYQRATPIALGESAVSTTADDRVDGSKFFFCDVGEGQDFLDVTIASETKSNGLDLYVNTPAAPYFPHGQSHELASTNGFAGGNQEWVYIDPPAKVMPGRYRISVMRPGREGCAQFRISSSAEKIPILANKKMIKKQTRRAGEFFFFEIPEGAKKLTVVTESIVKGNILDLYLNAPVDEVFPTPNAFRYNSANGFEKGAFERIEVPEPEAGMYRIFVKNLKSGQDYMIRAAWE